MRDKRRSAELDKTVYRDKMLADIVEQVIQNELHAVNYSSEKIQFERHCILNKMYTHIFADKDMSLFQFSQIDDLLKEADQPKMLRIFKVVIFLLKKGIVIDSKLTRLLTFEHRFTTQGVSYEQFSYLMNSTIYEQFVEDKNVIGSMYAGKLFFSTCESLELYDDEIQNVTEEWCESVKLDRNLTPSTRVGRLSIMHGIAKTLFTFCGIDGIKRSDLLNINNKNIVLEYLQFIDTKHPLAVDLRYLISFKDYFVGSGVRKFEEMCCVDNIFQYTRIVDKNNNNCIYKIDIPTNTILFQDMVEFISACSYRNEEFTSFIESFFTSMGEYAVENTPNLSMDTLKASAKFYLGEKKEKYFYSFLYSFYNFCYNKYRINFFEKEGVDIALIEKIGLIRYLNSGYIVAKYNPYDAVPSEDKWILCYQPEYDAATEHSPTKSIVIDFSDVHNEIFRKWLKQYVWYTDKSLKSKRNVANIIKEALNYVHLIRTRKVVVIYCHDIAACDAPFTKGEIMAVRQFYLAQDTTDVTKHSKIYNFRAFLQFLEDYDIAEVSSGLFYHLYHQNEPNNNSKAVFNKELSLLTKVVADHAKNSLQEELYSVIYAIALDTNFRISKIVSLQPNCVVETAKKGEYVIVAREKDETTDNVTEPITIETQRMIKHAKEITKELRQNAPKHLKNFLFIVPKKGSVGVRKINGNNFNIYLKKCCVEAGVAEYTPANLRDTHMTKAKEYQIREQLSELELSVLTGHKTPSVDIEHYVDMNITTMMEALHGVIIGNVDIKGRIVKRVPTDIAVGENEVSNGCGYCQSASCENFTYLDCLMCRNFVTMPSRLSFFEDEIKRIDLKIRRAKTPHDKEDYINIKRLLVAYVTAIKNLKEVD